MPKKKKGKDLLEAENVTKESKQLIKKKVDFLMAREVNPKDKRVCPECGSTRTVNKMLFPGKGLYKLCNNCFAIFDPDGLVLLTIGEAEIRLE